MLVKRAADREWMSAGYEGADRAVLRLSKEEGRTSIVRMKACPPQKLHQALAATNEYS